jgi:hypothetical protein
MIQRKLLVIDPPCEAPGWSAETEAAIKSLDDIGSALRDLERQGLVRSRKNPVTGMTEWRITKKGIALHEKGGH